MSGTLYGQGRTRRDDVYNKVMDVIFKGQNIPLTGFYQNAMSALTGSNARDIQVLHLNDPETGESFIVCGTSICGGTDVCG